VEAIVAPSRER